MINLLKDSAGYQVQSFIIILFIALTLFFLIGGAVSIFYTNIFCTPLPPPLWSTQTESLEQYIQRAQNEYGKIVSIDVNNDGYIFEFVTQYKCGG